MTQENLEIWFVCELPILKRCKTQKSTLKVRKKQICELEMLHCIAQTLGSLLIHILGDPHY